MPLGSVRDKVLRGMGRARQRAHRYTLWRWVVATVLTGLIAAIPLTGLLRFDFWRGNHLFMGERVGLVDAAKHFAFPFLAINIGIILASRFIGRYLCGFGCPYGALARLQEWLRSGARTRAEKVRGKLALVAVVAILCGIVFSFFVDWRVFAEGTGLERGLAASFLLGMIAVFYVALRSLGLRFCRDLCPSGVYFALLGHSTYNGIEFAHPETCTDCKACERVCPVDLDPRRMSGGPWRGERGLYSDGLSNFSNCIRCGDCVLACDGINVRGGEPVSLRMGWLPPEARDSSPPAEGAAEPKR